MITRDSLRSQARDIVLEMILTGTLEPGESINVSELAGELGISRTPLREALLGLVEQGLVGIADGNQGFHVWPLTLTEARNLGDIGRALESLALRKTTSVSPETIAAMRRVNERLSVVQGEPRRMMRWDDEWHDLLVSECDNADLVQMIGQLRNRFHRYRWYGYDYVALHNSDAKKRSVAQHAEITDAMEAGDFEEAARRVEEHWDTGIDLLARWLPKREEFAHA